MATDFAALNARDRMAIIHLDLTPMESQYLLDLLFAQSDGADADVDQMVGDICFAIITELNV